MVRYFIDRFVIFFPVLKKGHKIIIIDNNSSINIKTGEWQARIHNLPVLRDKIEHYEK